jgi:hypothetical protein
VLYGSDELTPKSTSTVRVSNQTMDRLTNNHISNAPIFVGLITMIVDTIVVKLAQCQRFIYNIL